MSANLLQMVEDHWRTLPEGDALRQLLWECRIYAHAGVLDQVLMTARGHPRRMRRMKGGVGKGPAHQLSWHKLLTSI